MKLSKTALALSTLCLGIWVSGCGTQRVAQMLPTPKERLVCERSGTRPVIPPEYKIDWTKVKTVGEAKAEHDKYVATVFTREGIVAGYVLKLEGVNFICWNNMEWRRNYEAGVSSQ